ncbi:ribosome small subunit-dependent GTPase A [Paenibacillus sp. FSL W8-1187]|uniref:Small ribosomal subunit biogenesis GTPase RsgA n=1 Tax=Paenibacillus pasadenensis TaxID=217090 RepID=A0A2N5N7J6_9BACL|nr:ribosome small subunit-dependent GTPase A [Paenibacillus pasadenensis]PLT46327.1 Ribosome small subunit-stimulated GTPase EngC [Paenibacillus pasadenensis]
MTKDGSAREGQGLIVKALSGYYYVAEDGGSEQPIQCRARGIFKKRGESPLVGDRVDFSVSGTGEGTVEAIHPRTTELVRPPVANADLAVLVFSVTEPSLSLTLLDKFLVHIEHAGLEAVLCLSKQDLSEEGRKEAIEAAETVQRIYGRIGYRVIGTSSRQGSGLEELRGTLEGRLALFAGQSGVGKSSLLNALLPGLELETSEISARLGRGRHTTRHVELVRVGSGYVADTPGFSQLDFQELGIEDLGYGFREFRALSAGCKFRGCTHTHEPDCAVLAALAAGEAAQSRHDSYVQFLGEMKEKKRRY